MRLKLPPNTPSKLHILVVEDDRNVRDLILTRLAMAGYSTSVARDGAEALEAIRLSRPDAVVLDISLPKLDGFEVLRELRLKPASAVPPVMVLTARNAQEDIKAALALGARDYMSKPFDHAQLLFRLSRLLRKRPTPPRSGGGDILEI